MTYESSAFPTKSETTQKRLINKLQSKQALIGIVGLGYVGFPLSLTFAEAGYRVLGLDIDPGKITSINESRSYIHHIDDARVEKIRREKRLEATTKFALAAEVDALIICVPTPLNQYREPDLSFIQATMESLVPHLRTGQVLSLESTTYPGTTEEEIKPLIEAKGLTVGKDTFLVYSPEREDPGNAKYDTANIPKIVGGSTPACLEVGIALYENAISEVVAVSSTQAAEMTKLLENIHRAVNIGLVNELKPLADRMGIDLYEVIRAAATKPFGFAPYYPGPGLGGHCIPIDPFYLTWKAREYGMHTRFIELAGEINAAMPWYVIEKVMDSLNNCGKPLKGSKALVLGIAYKKNVDDMRESPSVELIALLKRKGALVQYSDPFFHEFPKIRKYKFELKNTKLTAQSIKEFDVVILATDHDAFDYALIKSYSQLLIDTRGRYAPSSNIVRG